MSSPSTPLKLLLAPQALYLAFRASRGLVATFLQAPFPASSAPGDSFFLNKAGPIFFPSIFFQDQIIYCLLSEATPRPRRERESLAPTAFATLSSYCFVFWVQIRGSASPVESYTSLLSAWHKICAQ